MVVRKILKAFAVTIVPELSEADEDTWEKFEDIFENLLRNRPRNLQRRLDIFLHAIQWLPLIRYQRPFTSLEAKERTKFLKHLEDCRFELVRKGFWGLRTICFACYYGQEKAARAIGYSPHSEGWEAER